MNVKNCRDCRRLFNYVAGPPICPSCREKREEKFSEVKKYIQEHPGANIHDVSEDCDVEVSQIQQWIRESRLQFADDSPIAIPCESCGAMIKAGRYCDKCTTSMVNELGSVYKKPQKMEDNQKKKIHDSDRMRFLDRQGSDR